MNMMKSELNNMDLEATYMLLSKEEAEEMKEENKDKLIPLCNRINKLLKNKKNKTFFIEDIIYESERE